MLPDSFKFKKVNSMLQYAGFADRIHKDKEFTAMNNDLSQTGRKCR